tara:strand:- start:1417 stop:1854 length:438 start_codon:yes stop_codon:yes gene_type:complete
MSNQKNQKTIDILKTHEGFRSSVYKCTAGLFTIGFGRMVDESLSGGITKDEAEYLLKNDIEKCEKILKNKLPFFINLSENRQIVLLDMYFNLGNRLFNFVNTLKFIEDNNFEEASKEMLSSKWANQVGQRAITLSNIMKDDVFIS